MKRMGTRKGFSAIEAVFSAAILSVLAGGVFTLFYSNQFGALQSGDQSVAMTDTATALRGIDADLLPATAFTTPDTAGALRVTYATGPAVEYYLEGTTLKRLVASSPSSTSIVATGLVAGTGLSLSYYDSSMNAIAGPMDSAKYGQAVAVNVTVTMNLAHTAFGQVSRTTRVVLRNKVS